ncbi:MAG: RNA methyltransferase [Deltaproteobacteria bacterium]|nr:RNA methyltransferase [Deltaproteobacteria bacterium]MBW2072054.1 RNA methyltransferase [Deltaproteobacteria bacterium]
MKSTTTYLDNIAIVLHRPRFPENIGAAARAACNMGLWRLILVDPVNCDLTRILRMATHAAAEVVEKMDVYPDLAAALSSFSYVVGTTARVGGQRRELRTPRKMAAELVPICRHNEVAIVFGPEDRGLTNADLRFCHALVTIPTSGFSSLNLAQAVMIISYELLLAGRTEVSEFVPRLANRQELDAMYDHLEETFIKIGFINPENPDHWMQNIRRFFSRVGLRARDVKVIRGICRQIDWYTQRRLEAMERRQK